ncbi:MAG: 1-acyl-sn-glycerol-3-phosphate acyltransferase [Acidimicrobiales bacterium]|nr:1-acyl-sn-glycerol-3-phosphate acyltransferase [Acidimicrobiales bacterium]
MGLPKDFHFEDAADLPGSERISRAGYATLRRLVDRLWDVTVEGIENIPKEGPGILTPNHLSFCDSVFVPLSLPRRMWAIGKGEYMDSWKTKHIFPALGMIPVDRSGGDAAKAALDTAAKVLQGGHLFMIYPEGTRSRSGHLHKGRTGAARLAAHCNAPVIPVGHKGTVAVQPPDTFMMKPRLPVTVRFGEQMRPEQFGDPEDPRVLRRFTDAVMFEIAQLSEQTYVNQYASKDDTPDMAIPESDQPAPISVPPGRAKAVAPKLNGNGSTPKISVPKGRVVDLTPTAVDPAPN